MLKQKAVAGVGIDFDDRIRDQPTHYITESAVKSSVSASPLQIEPSADEMPVEPLQLPECREFPSHRRHRRWASAGLEVCSRHRDLRSVRETGPNSSILAAWLVFVGLKKVKSSCGPPGLVEAYGVSDVLSRQPWMSGAP